ncbi:MAG: ABC transporter ATP-binding protein, partial [Syntrophomonadaceae bacterium]
QYITQIMSSFVMLGFLFIMVPRATASAKRINEVLDTEISIIDPAEPVAKANICGEVEFRDVSFKFPDADAPTLCNISFKTKPGTVTAIIGSTGSGKSSIINLIPRFYDVTEGEVLVDGINVQKYTQKDLRAKIGFVPQKALLFSGTIRENLLFGNANATDEELETALEIAQAKNFISKLGKEEGTPEEIFASALDAGVVQGGRNFSGGQKQRLSIARALVKKPEIYIFDDSFSALDFKTDIRLRSALKGYTQNSSVIIVGQRVSSIMDADQILVLDDGRIAGIGQHNELLRSCRVYQEIVNSQLDPEEVEKTKLLRKQILLSEGENGNG